MKLNRWLTAGVLAGAGLAGAAATAVPASAATGPVIPSAGIGYQFTGAQFEGAHASVYLRNAAQFAPTVTGLNQSVQFGGGGKVYDLDVSDSTTAAPYTPALSVFDSSTHALLCSTTAGATPCPGTSPVGFGSASYPSGHTVTLSGVYNRATGTLKFTVRDATAGTSSSVTTDAGTGVAFGTVRIGSGFGSDPWSLPVWTGGSGFINPSPDPQKVATFTAASLTNYKGKVLGLNGYETASELTMNDGFVIIGKALALSASGFTTWMGDQGVTP